MNRGHCSTCPSMSLEQYSPCPSMSRGHYSTSLYLSRMCSLTSFLSMHQERAWLETGSEHADHFSYACPYFPSKADPLPFSLFHRAREIFLSLLPQQRTSDKQALPVAECFRCSISSSRDCFPIDFQTILFFMVKDQGVISDGSDMRAIASLSRNYQTRMEWDLVRGKLSSAFVGE